jgi:disulfide oxidoreductase YuzD
MITFLSFGSYRFTASAKRIENEAICSGWFNNVDVYTEDRLKNTEFWQNHGNFCTTNRRGFGYWIWKPWLIQNKLKELNEGDFLFYADAGCSFNPDCSRNIFDSIIENLEKSSLGIYCHQLSSDLLDTRFTKPETISALDCHEYTSSSQIMATILFIRKCPASVDFVNSWYEWCIKDNYIYVNDSYNSKYIIPHNFVDHRHDQSIFSLLVKKSSFTPCIVVDNTWIQEDGQWAKDCLIWATRRM